MDLATFRSRVSGEIGLSNVAGSAEQGLIDGWVNEAVEQFLAKTKMHVSESQMTTTVDVGDYELDTDILSIDRLIIADASGAETTLLPMSSDEIDERRRYASAGVDTLYFALRGASLLMLYPTPTSVLTISVRYVQRPTPMTAGTHDPSVVTYGGVPSEFHPILESYAKWKAASWDDDSSSQVGLIYKAEWEQGLKDARSLRNRKGGGWAPAKIGRRRRIPTSPGVDFRN